MITNRRTYLADMLLEKKLITQAQLDSAIEIQKTSDKKIGQILIEQGYIDENTLLESLAQKLQITLVDLKTYLVNPDIIKLLPEFYSRHLRAIVLAAEDEHYLVGMVDPQNLIAQDEIRHILKQPIKIALIREDDLLTILDRVYRRSEQISQFAEELSAEVKPDSTAIFSGTQDFSSEDMPVVNLLRSIFEEAARINASDIHIEPGNEVLYIRLRVDGVLQEQRLDEKEISKALVQRIKLMSGLNIAEKRLPQDGRFSITVDNKLYDVRVSSMPIQYGESVVMRLLNQSSDILRLKALGMENDVYDYFHKILTATYGIILIVGPTGSGKTTTLYAALNELNNSDDKIITVEDPVEYRLSRINQVQVNYKIGLTFANILRAILRQDPDIIMIGEVRDQETMEIAIRAAMTGHLVLATLHTNDTVSSITRLLDMGAEGYLLASVLRAVLAQRLVRKICTHCITDDSLTDAELSWLTSIEQGMYLNKSYKKGNGCTHCHQTGYKGRACLFELLPISADITDALRQSDTRHLDVIAKKHPAYHTLLQSGLHLAKQGVTTIHEVIRMMGEF